MGDADSHGELSLCFSALNLETRMHACLDKDTYQVKQEFLSLETWYVQGVGSDFENVFSRGLR